MEIFGHAFCTVHGETAFVPGEEAFLRQSNRWPLLTVARIVNADTETPVSAYLKLGGGSHSFLLESAEGGERWGRYSFIGYNPMDVVLYRNGRVEHPIRGETVEGVDPVSYLFQRLERFRTPPVLPGVPFSGGAVGYFGYDLLPFMDRFHLREKPGLDLPEMCFVFTRDSAVFDHLLGRLILMRHVPIPPRATEGEVRSLYREAASHLEEMAEKVRSPLRARLLDAYYFSPRIDGETLDSNLSREEFEEAVNRAKEYIYQGEIFQAVISQRFRLPLKASPFSIYRALRSENPSPYMFFLKMEDVILVGSSPEPMVRQRGGEALIRPIAGTRRRGRDPEEDRLLEEELTRDEKERAEHVMLVDLARNDLGRVCLPGSVRVTKEMYVEKYSHVMHLVSEVSGKLRPGKGNLDLLRATFPAGTVSGAPKIRACEIIDELEPERRGPYAGAVGYLSYTGDMDTCITIRTVIISGRTAYVQAGAGVVADSVPAREYEETLNKARALLRAIKKAESMEGVFL